MKHNAPFGGTGNGLITRLLNAELKPKDKRRLSKGMGERIEKLILDLQRLDEIRIRLKQNASAARPLPPIRKFTIKPVYWPRRTFAEPDLEALNKSGKDLIRDVNDRLRQFRWSPRIDVRDEAFLWTYDWYAKTFSDHLESSIVSTLLQWLRSGDIQSFRRCDSCNKWLFKETPHQKFCSETCRKKFVSGSEEFKAKRREYMKKYRQEESERNARSYGNL